MSTLISAQKHICQLCRLLMHRSNQESILHSCNQEFNQTPVFEQYEASGLFLVTTQCMLQKCKCDVRDHSQICRRYSRQIWVKVLLVHLFLQSQTWTRSCPGPSSGIHPEQAIHPRVNHLSQQATLPLSGLDYIFVYSLVFSPTLQLHTSSESPHLLSMLGMIEH